jgi:cbb3-type cytochrome oxidase subunit 3
MRNLLYIIGIIYITGWLIGVFGYNAGGPFHLLLIIAFIAVALSMFQKKKVH